MARHTQHGIGNATPDTEIGCDVLEQIQTIQGMSIAELKDKWKELLGSEAPQHAKRSFLTQTVSWEIQARTFGGMKPAIHRQLLQAWRGTAAQRPAAQSCPATLRPGVKLIRVWKGVSHHVLVTGDGFLWQDRTWRSLSMIAKEMTGTNWSGPVFFGLKKHKAASGKTRTDSEVEGTTIDRAEAVREEAHG